MAEENTQFSSYCNYLKISLEAITVVLDDTTMH
jgi:hypothetical protein